MRLIFRRLAGGLAVAGMLGIAGAEDFRIFPAGQRPDDPRLGPLQDLNGYFPFTPSPTPAAWTARAGELRQQLRVALGLWPEPTRTPLRAVMHGRVEAPEYTVEKVFFEAMPGSFVSGSLYRPLGAGPFPAVLCPHGHWPTGRFQRRTDAEMQKALSEGEERFLESGRSVFQSFAVQLARLGCVAFVVDLIGYGDSQQIGPEIAHKFAAARPEMATREDWGLFSPQAEIHAQNVLGLQTWSLIRSLDFLTTLPEVDAERLACAGASSGGTQTLMLGALDPRLAVSVPTVMVSTAMQGGCVCENAPLLRVGTGNVEIAALFAPKPLGLVSANDWTKEMATKGFPELQQHWALLGAPELVQHWPLLQYGHNFNAPSREKVYRWLNQHLRLGWPEDRLHEREYELLSPGQLTVWDAAHPAPAGGPLFERGLLRWWHEDAQRQMPQSPDVPAPAWRTILGGQNAPASSLIHVRSLSVRGRGISSAATLSLRRAQDGSFELPQLVIEPAKFSNLTVLWLDERGKAGLLAADGELRPEISQLLAAGVRVVGVDLLEQGEFRADGQPLRQTRRVENPRPAAAYTFGYNRALFAQRVQDICATVTDWTPARTAIVALDGTGPLAAAALFLQPGLGCAVLDTRGFRFAEVTDLQDPNFLPAAAKYGDLPGLLTLAAPQHLYVFGEKAGAFPQQAGETSWTFAPGRADATVAVNWLLKAKNQ